MDLSSIQFVNYKMLDDGKNLDIFDFGTCINQIARLLGIKN